MIYFDGEHAQIFFHDEEDLVEIVWKETEPDSAAYKLILSKGLILLKQKNASKWLSDMTSVKEISEQDREWVEDYIVSEVAKNGLKKIALVLRSGLKDCIFTPSFRKVIRTNKMKMRSFLDPELARKWVKD